MKNKNQEQTPYVWNERLKRYVYISGSSPKDKNGKGKNPTGFGVKSSGKRQRCCLAGCQAFASPSGSRVCSHHEQKLTPLGEKVADALLFKCRMKGCNEPRFLPKPHTTFEGEVIGLEDEDCGLCKAHADERFRIAVNGESDDSGLDDFDLERPLGNMRGLGK